MNAIADWLRPYRRTLLALLAFPIAMAAIWAAWPARPRAAWAEGEGDRVVAFSPDGRALVTDGRRGARLRDAATGRVRAVLCPREWGFHYPTFSPDGGILIAEVDSTQFQPVRTQVLKIWDVATGRERAAFAHVGEGISGSPNYTLAADGRTLAFADNSGRLPMWVRVLDFAVDGTPANLAINENRGPTRVIVWDVARKIEMASVPGRPPLALSSDGGKLAATDPHWPYSQPAASRVPEVTIWDSATGRPSTTFRLGGQGRESYPGRLAFSPDGTILASNGLQQVTLWDLLANRELAIGGKGEGTQAPVFSLDGKLVFPIGLPHRKEEMNLNKEFTCWDLAATPPRKVHLPRNSTISRDGTRLLRTECLLVSIPPSPACVLTLFALPSMREVARYHEDSAGLASLAPDSRGFVLRTSRLEPPGTPSQFQRWFSWLLPRVFPQNANWRHIVEIRVREGAATRDAIRLPEAAWVDADFWLSPDGKTLAVAYTIEAATGENPADKPRTIELWDIPPRSPVGPAIGLAASLSCVTVLIGLRLDLRARSATDPA